jgi:hypothetical protein
MCSDQQGFNIVCIESDAEIPAEELNQALSYGKCYVYILTHRGQVLVYQMSILR